jgi:hypothetical protein
LPDERVILVLRSSKSLQGHRLLTECEDLSEGNFVDAEDECTNAAKGGTLDEDHGHDEDGLKRRLKLQWCNLQTEGQTEPSSDA